MRKVALLIAFGDACARSAPDEFTLLSTITEMVNEMMNRIQRANGAKISVAKSQCANKKKCCKKYKKGKPCKNCPFFR